MFLVNDPCCGGTHLIDVKMVKPFFYRGWHWAWLANTGHWPDTGGAVPGGFSTRGPQKSSRRGCACPWSSSSAAA